MCCCGPAHVMPRNVRSRGSVFSFRMQARMRSGCVLTFLQSLDVSGCELVTEVGLQAVAASHPRLKQISAAVCGQVRCWKRSLPGLKDSSEVK